MTAPRFVRLTEADGLRRVIHVRADAISLATTYAVNGKPTGRAYVHRVDGLGHEVEESVDDVLALLAAPAPWQLPADAGICADDLDECTVTLALSSEAEVRAARAALPLRNRVRVMPDTRHRPAPSVEVTEAGDGVAAALGRLWAEGFDVPRPVVVDAIEAADRARGLRE